MNDLQNAKTANASERPAPSLTEFLAQLKTSTAGLSAAEAKQRLTQYGYNELPEKKRNPFLEFFSHFWGPIPWMIEAAVVLSALVRHWADFIIILVLLPANAVVGFWEESQAGNAIAALKANLALKARVKRDGAWSEVPARDLVPGDLVRLRLGDLVPTDARLLDGDPVEVDQSALTGESLPVERKPSDSVYSGSILKKGEIDTLVSATGKQTYFGKTAQLVESAHTASHFQKAVLKIGDYLIVIAVALVALIIAAAMFRGDKFTTTLQFALVLTVAAIPVAMPTVLSVTMAVGARLLARKQAIVSRLVAIEELADMDVLCSDKTGTLTQNKLTLGEPFTVGGVKPDEVVLAAALASRAEAADAIDQAVLNRLSDKGSLKSHPVLHFQPFDPVGKRTEATLKAPDGKQFRVSKGAPQVILKLAGDAGPAQTEAEKAVSEFAARGFRSLGVARTDGQDHWPFLGVLPLSDTPREDSKSTIETAKEMGVRVKMVTGDQVAIGKEIAKQVGLETNILDASLFAETSHHQGGQLDEAIENFPADEQLRHLPNHRDNPGAVVHDALNSRLQFLPGDGGNDCPAGAAERWCNSVYRLRPGRLLGQTGSLEHEGRVGHCFSTGRCRRDCFVWALLLGRTGLSFEPRNDSDPNVSETVCRRPPHDFCHADRRPVLVHTPRAGAAGRRDWHATGGDLPRRVRGGVNAGDWLGLGVGSVGLRAGVVFRQRPH
jgi:H+-transporting ATPase